MNWFYQTLNPEIGEALAEVKKTNVARLPFRLIDLKNKQDKKNHDRMVELVERMIKLNKDIRKAKTSHKKEVIQRQINATDKPIDKLVYKHYDITEEEIQNVE